MLRRWRDEAGTFGVPERAGDEVLQVLAGSIGEAQLRLF